jgi:hypothetical protein
MGIDQVRKELRRKQLKQTIERVRRMHTRSYSLSRFGRSHLEQAV